MNQYLEKIALNAFKARQMAKQVGVISDPDSAWKWALRNLRNGRGEPLQGKALAEKRVRLGDLSDHGYKAVSNTEKYKTWPGQEFSAKVNNSGDVESGIVRGGYGRVTFGAEHNLHNHPRYNPLDRLYETVMKKNVSNSFPDSDYRRKGGPHRLAAPSGYGEMVSKSQLIGKPQISQIARETKDLYDKSNRALERWYKVISRDYPADKQLKANRVISKASQRSDYAADKARRYTLSTPAKPILDQDLHAFNWKRTSGNTSLQRIAAPSANTVSVTKTYSNPYLRPRLTYFDHTPRKTK